jgi:hypothetical protein
MGGGGEVVQVASHPHALRVRKSAALILCCGVWPHILPRHVLNKTILPRAFLRMLLFEQRQDQNVKALYLGVKDT